MLSIFKSYSAKTSLLDDFKFYEGREKSLKAHRSTKPTLQTDVLKEDDSPVSLSLSLSLSLCPKIDRIMSIFLGVNVI
mgnify:CR=1 FL=1